MTIQRVSISFLRYSDAGFEGKGKHILACITGNTSFPEPNPSVTALTDAVTDYSTKRIAAANLGRIEVAAKNAARETLEIMLEQLGNYVMNVANGNVEMLTGSGFTLIKEREPRYITNPGGVTLSNGVTSGTLVASVVAVPGAGGYIHEISEQAPTENQVWVSAVTTTSRYTYTNLLPGKQYWVRVAAIGARKQIAYSTVATQFAQ